MTRTATCVIVDTSALVAIAHNEPCAQRLHDAIVAQGALVPAPVLVEFARVVTDRGKRHDPGANAVLRFLMERALTVEPLTQDDAAIAAVANEDYGLGNGRGGTLNFGDLMVYAVAKRRGMAVLCTGRDFAATDITVHSASRIP